MNRFRPAGVVSVMTLVCSLFMISGVPLFAKDEPSEGKVTGAVKLGDRHLAEGCIFFHLNGGANHFDLELR